MPDNPLPIAKYEQELIEIIKKNQVVIIYGDTGSGKTTQIPQYIFKSGINKNLIIGITQPRQIGATSMCERVSKEMGTTMGKEVGYEIRFDNKSDHTTKIKYMTDGILLNHCVYDFSLKQYGVIMIDEAHERSAHSDVLLGLLKRVIKERKDLKLLIVSSTMKKEKFSSYFNDAPMISILGRSFPVITSYISPEKGDYVTEASNLVKKIHARQSSGDVLIFLTGQDEIWKCCELLGEVEGLVLIPAHASLDTIAREKIFLKVPDGKRKVVVATNVAENTITIDNVRFVIDCGYVKQNSFNTTVGSNALEKIRISQAQANQRSGRCGRTLNGCCFRLYTEEVFDNMLEEVVPIIKRTNMSDIYLKIATLKINPLEFDFIDSPERNQLEHAERELEYLNLIDSQKQPTDMGMKMRNLPVDAVLGVVLLSSYNFYCAEDVITVMSIMNESKNLVLSNVGDDTSAANKQVKFFDSDGDHFTQLNMFKEFINNEHSRQWCEDNSLSYDVLVKIVKLRDQLMKMMRDIIPLEEYSSSRNKNDIKKAIIKGYYRNICKKISPGKYTRLLSKEIFYIHPSSCLIQESPDLIMYHEIFKTKKSYMHGIMKLDKSVLVNFTNEMEKLGVIIEKL